MVRVLWFCPMGVLFRGNAEAEIRTNIIKRGYIKGIIGLPANLFYGTGIPACIIVLDKEGAANRKGLFMIDASKGFIKDGNKNRLREQDMRKIVDVFNSQSEVSKFSRFVPNEEIEKNEYNLNILRYIDSQEEEDVQNIDSHLKGGIPEHDVSILLTFWNSFPSLKNTLFSNGDRPKTFKVHIEKDEIRNTIYNHEEFSKYNSEIIGLFKKWTDINKPKMLAIKLDDRPKIFINKLGDSMLSTFRNATLIDAYDIYQHLLNYWGEAMQDDLYTLVADGWEAGNQVVRLQKENKDKKKKDIEGLDGLEGRLIPPSLLISEYFQEEEAEIEKLESDLETATASAEEIKEEHDTEDGLLAEVMENEKVNKGMLAKRIKEIKHDPESREELDVLEKYQDLLDKETELKREIKIKYSQLERKVIEKYPRLSLDEVKTLVVDKKWLRALNEAVIGEIEKVAQKLTGRVKELAERYDETLPQIATEVKTLEQKVDEHLKRMGFEM